MIGSIGAYYSSFGSSTLSIGFFVSFFVFAADGGCFT